MYLLVSEYGELVVWYIESRTIKIKILYLLSILFYIRRN